MSVMLLCISITLELIEAKQPQRHATNLPDPATLFTALDSNRNGAIDQQELDAKIPPLMQRHILAGISSNTGPNFMTEKLLSSHDATAGGTTA